MAGKRKSKIDDSKLKEAVLELVKQASAAGMPRDQVAGFVKGDYAPLPWQMKFHAAARMADEKGGPLAIGEGGCRGPGKSHAAMAQVGLDDCQRKPGLKALFLRKTKMSASESLDDLVRRVLHGIEYDYSASQGKVTFPNGSRILIGGYQNEADIEKYVGIEYDVAVIEEATQISEEKIIKFRGSVRSSRSDYRERIYMTTNPGGIGHRWFKKNIVEGRGMFGEPSMFIPATYKDNPFLKDSYRNYLESIAGQLGKAWRDGDWDAFAGQAFPLFDPGKHIIQPFMIPENWFKWRGIDEGFTAPWACLWAARDPNTRRIYVYREAYAKQLTIRQQAERVKDMTPDDESVAMTYADPAMWAQKNMEGIISSSADEYLRNGVPLTKADNKRVAGKRKVDGLLANMPDGMPGVMIFNTCTNLTEQLENLPVASHNPEDVDTDAEDHCLIVGTMVTTNDGDKPIESIVAGDLVLTRAGYKPVLKSWMTNDNASVYEVLLSNGNKLVGTGNHPVWVEGKGFVRLDALRYYSQTNTVISKHVAGSAVRVCEIKKLKERQPVYNLHVAECNEYFANGVLVHNCYDAFRYLLSNVDAGVVEKEHREMARHPALDVGIF